MEKASWWNQISPQIDGVNITMSAWRLCAYPCLFVSKITQRNYSTDLYTIRWKEKGGAWKQRKPREFCLLVIWNLLH